MTSPLELWDHDVATTTGTWSPVVSIPEIKRDFHYVFNAEIDGRDINGFIVEKTKNRRHRFKVYHDTDADGAFTKSDKLIGKSKLRRKHSKGDAGELLDGVVDGHLEVDYIYQRYTASYRLARESEEFSEPVPLEEDYYIELPPPPIIHPCGYICESMLEERMVFSADSRGNRQIVDIVVDIQNLA